MSQSPESRLEILYPHFLIRAMKALLTVPEGLVRWQVKNWRKGTLLAVLTVTANGFYRMKQVDSFLKGEMFGSG